jgi:speckle-type POZ protein
VTETESVSRRIDLSLDRADDLKSMFPNQPYSDFLIEANDGITLKCHKFILAARSKVFFAMLTQEMSEAETGLVKVKDFDSVLLMEVLRFIYCNEVNDLDKNAHELIYAAEKYDLDGLKKMCLDEIVESLDEENVLEALLIAHEIESSQSLYIGCLKVIIR